MSPISAGDREAGDPADPRGASSAAGCSDDRRPSAAARARSRAIAPVEIVDQLKAGVDVTSATARGNPSSVEQPAAGDAEQVGHRDAGGRRRSASRARGSSAIERCLTRCSRHRERSRSAAQLGRRQPDRRHQIPERQLRQHPRVDLVGLARQRRQPLDLLRVGDQHLPAVARPARRARTARRSSTPPPRAPARHTPPPAAPARTGRRDPRARRKRSTSSPSIGDQAHLNPLATQIQTNVQHSTPSFRGRRAGSARPTA